MRPCRHTLAFTIALVLIAPAATSLAQEKEISCDGLPAAVHGAFETTYPKATIKSCTDEILEGKPVYEISSTEGDAGLDVIFDTKGDLVVEERTISAGDVPQVVMEAVHKKFPSGKITLVESVKEGDAVGYEFRVTDQGKEEVIELDAEGKVKP